MSAYIGRTFSRIISSLSENGMFVELPNTVERNGPSRKSAGIELTYDGVASLTDRRGRPCYTIGEEIEVLVAACDISSGRISFVPA